MCVSFSHSVLYLACVCFRLPHYHSEFYVSRVFSTLVSLFLPLILNYLSLPPPPSPCHAKPHSVRRPSSYRGDELAPGVLKYDGVLADSGNPPPPPPPLRIGVDGAPFHGPGVG